MFTIDKIDMKIIYSLLTLIFLSNTVHASDNETLRPIEIKPLTKNVWLHISGHTFENGTTYYSNGLIVKQDNELILIDSAWGEEQTQQLLKKIENTFDVPVTSAIATHWHDDRAGGANVLKKAGIKFYAQPKTIELARENNKPVPEFSIDKIQQAGDTASHKKLQLLFPGPAHAMDNIIVWLPEQKVLFGGCAIRSKGAKTLGYTQDGDVNTWINAMNITQKHFGDAKIVVPGHGKVGNTSLITHTQALVTKHLSKNK